MIGLPSRLVERRIRMLRRRGDQAMVARNWRAAAGWYSQVLAIRLIPEIQIQQGHAFKEAGEIDSALRAYAAVPLDGAMSSEARFHRAVLLGRRGQREEAIEELAAVLRADTGHRGALAELIHLGGRHRLPEGFQNDSWTGTLPRLAENIAHLRRELATLEAASVFPTTSYEAFRRSYPILPPPTMAECALTVLVDARDKGPAFVRSTLLSLLDQTVQNWTAVVMASEAVAVHTVASLAASEPRILFARQAPPPIPGNPFMHLSAGTLLDPHAIAWFSFVMERIGTPALWCDFDFGYEDRDDVLRRHSPKLWGAYDRDLIAQIDTPPAVILVDPDRVACPELGGSRSDEWRRRALLAASHAGHIPRILATSLRIPDAALDAPDDGETALWSTDPSGTPPALGTVVGIDRLEILDRGRRPRVSISSSRHGDRIATIIQTRDAVDILRKAVETIHRNAARPDLLTLVIVDNASSDPATLAYLSTLRMSGSAIITRLDEPFNWARGNNVAIEGIETDIVVFANNDIEMLTTGWDNLLRGYLQRDSAGIVGTRLLYPGGLIQHAGILFGVGDHGPVHDGVHAEECNSGPLDRYDLTHAAAAVTGAFMAIRSDVLTEVGGFDELRLAIAYNDIDLCLRVRETGRTVLYAPAIELIHHESKTRGQNVGRSRVSWDLGEFASLRKRWPEAWARDPSYNLQWSRDRPFDGFREPTIRQILDAIDRNALPEPWRVVSAGNS